MPVSVLKNKTAAAIQTITGPSVVTSTGERATQSTTEVMTNDGILIYHLLPMNSLVCWNSKTPFTIENQHTIERVSITRNEQRIQVREHQVLAHSLNPSEPTLPQVRTTSFRSLLGHSSRWSDSLGTQFT